ncbi:aminoglycoside phosphotransferase family protein [Streptomyces kunmingensis]|uniref:Aminoglycoside phosphotransferase family protein n=1 Tax=Streptomyces kunmingensis TaxID=68225 RepID=A0ABU6C6W6_9ACTN|nr:aminoglycoside phosphotransferase family protein [Streptomyces kunmingensis]MEB3960244.1 aminoglycoside phosphotransferase family protein [Streptomyces kunmingensis]
MSTAPGPDRRPRIDTSLVRRLVDAQFPQWSGLPLRLLDPAGSDHVIHRLGDELSVRLPRHSGAIGQAEKEWYWLPRLAPGLPLTVPEPVAVGRPALGYPWPWAVTRWLDGEVATVEGLGDSTGTARELAAFLRALRAFDPGDAGGRGEAEGGGGDGGRADPGSELAERDAGTRAAIAAVSGVFDAPALTALWDAALAGPGHQGPPVWFHGDFHTGNLLTVGGRLSAVIDFGGFGLGDPSVDLMIAFTLMSPRARAVFRGALGVDEATWLRGRGWALTTGLSAYTAYAATSPRIAEQTARQIRAALAG